MLKNLILSIIILSFLFNPSFALFEREKGSARIWSLGNGGVALSDEASVIGLNPSGLGFLNKKEIQASWSELFGLKELSSGDFYLVYPFRKINLGLGYNIFGKKDYYQENILSFALGYRLGERVSVGSNLKYMNVSFTPSYGSYSIWGIDGGVSFKFNKKIQIGASIQNINKPRMFKNSSDIPRVWKAGISLFPFENVILLLDFEKESGYGYSIHFGQEIKILKQLDLRFGIETEEPRYGFGTGFEIERIKIDYAYLSHPNLGGSHKVSFSVRW